MNRIFKFLLFIISGIKKKPIIFLLDFQLIALAYLFAFLLRLDFSLTDNNLKILLFSFPLVFTLKVIIYLFFKIDKIIWRYTSVKDLVAIIKTFTLSNVIYGPIVYSLIDMGGYPRSVIIIDWFLSIILLTGVRVLYRIYFKKGDKTNKQNKKCLILGSSDSAEFLVRQMLANHQVDYYPVGILDNDPHTWKRYLHGVKIFGPIKDVYKYSEMLQIEEIIIAIPSATHQEMKTIIQYCESCRELGIKYKIVPGVNDILFGRQSPLAIREIKLDDLINRELVVTNKMIIREEFGKKIVIVTGAAGSIGSELVKQLSECKPSLMLLIDRNENNLMYLEKALNEIIPKVNYRAMIADITNQKKMEVIFKEFNPQYVFHAAAYKHVSYMEKHPDEAVKNNILGTYSLAKLADKYNVKKFINISTDKAVNPSSVMGCSKRVAELCLLNLFHESNTEFVVVRF